MREYTQEDYSKAYSWAELSSNEEYPDYLKKETEKSLDKIKSYQGDGVFNVAFITDIHYSMTETNRIRMKRILNMYKEIAENVEIERLVLGGDHTCDACREYKYDAFADLKAQFGDIKFFPINGNHDDGTIWDMKFKNEKSEHYLTTDERYEVFFADANTQNKELYYFSDDEKKKIRYIFLDSNDIDCIFDNGKLRYCGQDLFIYSQKQLDWLLNEALVFEEQGWGVMLFMHALPLENETTKLAHPQFKNLAVLYDIIKAYKNGENIDIVFEEGDFERHICAEFAGYNRAEIIACVQGDTHSDNQYTGDSGVPCITERNAFPFFYDPPHIERNDGDKTEVAFVVITVNKNSRKVYVTRIGKGEDAVLEY